MCTFVTYCFLFLAIFCLIIQKQTFGVDNVNYLLYNKITINIQITQNKIIGGLLSMNKNKIFKNLKKLTAVSLTTANLFTFANSGSAKILNLNNKEDKKIVLEFIKKSGFSDRLKDEKEFSFENLVKTLCNVKEVTGQTEIYKTDTPIDFLKVDQGNTPVKNMEPNQLYVYDVTALEKENQKNTENYYNGDEMKQNNFISLDDFIKLLNNKEKKKEEAEATPGANNTQNNQEKPKKGSFVSKHKELISGGLIGTGVLTIVASAVTIFWNEVKTGCNFVAEKAVELKNKIVKAVK